MEVALSPSATTIITIFNTIPKFSIKLPQTPLQARNLFLITLKPKFRNKNHPHSSATRSDFKTDNPFLVSCSPSSSSLSSISSPSSSTKTSAASTSSPPSTSSASSSVTDNRHWMVVMEAPPRGFNSRTEIVDYYVETLQRVLGSEKDAQMCLYDASWDTHFGFCCDIDEETSRELGRLPGVLSVRPDPDFISAEKDYTTSGVQFGSVSNTPSRSSLLFPAVNSKHWLVRLDKPSIGIVTKALMADYYTQLLTKVMG
ncbi:RNA recognition motif, partial [Sarracenia purpurea var. burkii]